MDETTPSRIDICVNAPPLLGKEPAAKSTSENAREHELWTVSFAIRRDRVERFVRTLTARGLVSLLVINSHYLCDSTLIGMKGKAVERPDAAQTFPRQVTNDPRVRQPGHAGEGTQSVGGTFLFFATWRSMLQPNTISTSSALRMSNNVRMMSDRSPVC